MAREDWDFIQISLKTQACPICGHNDWCFMRKHRIDGNIEYCCHRATNQSDVLGVDGNVYFWKREMTPSTGVIEVFETEEDRKLRKGAFSSTNKAQRPVFQQPADRVVEGDVPIASADELNRFNRGLIGVMRLSEKHRASLSDDWNTPSTPNLFARVTEAYPILSCPEKDFITSRYGYQGDRTLPKRKEVADTMSKSFGDISKYPGFVINPKGENDIVSSSGIWFPIFDKNGNLISWRVRCDFPDKKGQMPDGREGVFSHSYDKNGKESTLFYFEGNKEETNIPWTAIKGKTQNKYKNLCGVFEKREGERYVNVYGKGCRVGSLLSLYTKPKDNMSVVFITEGEKKAMVANVLSGYPVISVPGVSCFMKLFEKQSDGESMMDSLKRRGCRLAVVCYDADKAANKYVLSAQDGLAKALSECQMQVAIGEWDSHWGKGLDDVLVHGIKPTICPVRL